MSDAPNGRRNGISGKSLSLKIETLVTILVLLVSLIASVVMGGIPWAYSVHGRLTAIETKIADLRIPPDWFQQDVKELERTQQDIQRRLSVLENNQAKP